MDWQALLVNIHKKILVAGLLFFLLLPGRVVLADGPPERYVIEQQERTAFIWVVGAWNFETCRILTDHIEVVPQRADVFALCGITSVDLIDSGVANIYYLGEYEYYEDVKIELPRIIIKTDYIGSSIIVDAVEPMPGHTITRIEANFNGAPAVCDRMTGGIPIFPGGLRCTFPFYNPPVLFSACAVSDYGDNSKIVRLRIGNTLQSDLVYYGPKNKYGVIGDNAYTQYNIYHDIPRRWGVIPGEQILPEWVKTVPLVSLESDHTYYYLSAQILLETPYAGHNCPNGGINGRYANICGVNAVLDVAYQFQNSYNREITDASRATGVPNALIKRIVAVESQFVPGALGTAGERGLYQLIRSGVDTLLRWNGPFYIEVCQLYFDRCVSTGYDNLAQWQRDVLSNHVLSDPDNLYYLGSTLRANAFQVDRLFENILGIENVGDFLTYEDLWKITVSNYHTGATVTSAVLQQMDQLETNISWEEFATILERLQPSGLKYVDLVVRGYE